MSSHTILTEIYCNELICCIATCDLIKVKCDMFAYFRVQIDAIRYSFLLTILYIPEPQCPLCSTMITNVETNYNYTN